MPDRLLITGLSGRPGRILVTDGLIEALDGDDSPDVPTIDGVGLSAAPGFIELQVNGVGDADFTAEPASIHRGGAMLPRHGVTSFLPTVVSSPRGTVEAALASVAGPASPDGAVPLGLHVEGPFISPHRLGAHDPAWRRDPDLDEIRAWLSGGVRMLTLAPELPGGLEAIEVIVAAGAIAAVGHTDADAATASRAIDAGARYVTHLFNAMSPLDHREPGPAGAILADERIVVGLIADGVHVHPLVLAIVARTARGRVSLVSDAVATGLGGRSLTHGPDGARLPDGTLAGGSSGLDHVVRTFAGIAGREAALSAVTEIPARLLGLDDGRGTLRVGGRADIVLLTLDLAIATTIVGGRVAFRSRGPAVPDPAPG
jgi:N-acetylglucosamine-6-phosphate deacetylase